MGASGQVLGQRAAGFGGGVSLGRGPTGTASTAWNRHWKPSAGRMQIGGEGCCGMGWEGLGPHHAGLGSHVRDSRHFLGSNKKTLMSQKQRGA